MSESSESIHDARRRLHDIVRADNPFDDKARDALNLATQCLGADKGHLARIDQETDYWEAVITTDTPDGQTPPESEQDLRDTYCRETIENHAPYALHNAPEQGWADDPAFFTRELHTYLGVPLIVDDEPYGTICFVAEEPRSEPFSDAETWFAEHLARLLERELEREQVEAKLTSQTNFATVLNRVLRHNLRNDISVIRGYTEIIADQLDDEPNIETVLSHIDDLIDMTQKARDLEQIITASSERRHTEIGSLIEKTVEPLRETHPAASISVEYDDEIHVDVLQNFDQAVEELVENAVKHSGDRPTVTVAIEQVPNAVEIRITDDGPGLPDTEAEVLETGAETPLTHGSGLGLWMAHWIITSHDGSLEPVVTEDGTTLTISIPRKSAVGVQHQLPELKRSRDKYKATFQEATDAIAIVNDDGRIMEANPAIETVFGMDSTEIIGRSLTEFLPDEFEFDPERQDFQQALNERDTVRVNRADGEKRVLEYSAMADIIPGQHLFISRDITERKERERRYNAIFNQTYQFTGLLEPDGTVVEANESALDFGGFDREDVVGKPLWEIDWWQADDTRQEVREAIERAAAGEFVRSEVPIHGEESTAIIDFSIRPITDEQDNVTLLIPEGRDVTERKEREREVEALKERYQSLLEAAPDPVFVADGTTGKLIEVNEAAESLLGLSSDELIGMHQSELHPSEQTELYQQLFEEHIESGGTKRRLPDGSRITIETAEGERLPVEISIATISLPNGPVIYGIFRDISEQVERKRELEETSQRLTLALEGTDTGVWEWDIQTDEVYCTKSLEELLGLDPGTFAGTAKAFVEYLHPDDVEETVETIENAAATNSRFQTEYRIQTADDRQRWVESRGKIYENDERGQRMVGIITDITDRKEGERTLRTRTQAMENAPVGITITDPNKDDNPMVYVNERFRELTGYDDDEIIGQNCRFLQGEKTDPEKVATIRNAIDNGEPVSTLLRNYRNDGTMFWNRLSIAPVTDAAGEITNWIGFQEDVTDRVEREQQLAQAETVFDNTQDALFVLDVTAEQEFRIQRVNEVYENLTGLSNEEIQGKTPREVFGDDTGSEIEARYQECVEQGETINYPEETPVDGELRHWQTKVTPVVEDGTVETLVGAMRDVTAEDQ